MTFLTPDVIICGIITASVGCILLLTKFLKAVFGKDNLDYGQLTIPEELHDSWVLRLLINLLGYATIFVPGFLIFQYVKRSKYFEKTAVGPFNSIIQKCFALNPDSDKIESPSTVKTQRSFFNESSLLLFCFFGLQGTYLTWGILQEKVMTQDYIDSVGNKEHFKDSQFLVFVNRILAFLLSGTFLLITRQPRHSTPLYKYIFCSFSNIMSSWCQYEALKFVSFPTQVLAKASKIIPVMIMGKIVSRKKYEYYEYVTAVLISMGMALFLFGSSSSPHSTQVTTISGVLLLTGYMLADSFTSNWQGALFKQYRVTPVQMMCGVNLFSCLFTAVSLTQQGGFVHSFVFMTQFPKFTLDCLVLSICSAAGQLFIFYTIATFGPVVFVIIMTVRQALAILLSCVIYHHEISHLGALGIVIVFLAVFLRIYCSQRLKRITRKRTLNTTPSKV